MTANEESAILLDKAVKAAMKEMPKEPKRNNYISATIKFSSGTVRHLLPDFAKEFRRNGRVAHIIKSYAGNSITYEICYRRNGVNITVSDKDLKEAKRKFILKAI